MKLQYKEIVNSGIPEEAIKRYIDFRRKKSKTFSQRSLEMAMRQVYKVGKELDISFDQIIDFAIYKGWTGIKYEWIKNSHAELVELFSDGVVIEQDSVVSTRDMTTQQEMSRAWAGLEGYTGDGLKNPRIICRRTYDKVFGKR